jgi:intein-encoded DNA endonuclease-like protein
MGNVEMRALEQLLQLSAFVEINIYSNHNYEYLIPINAVEIGFEHTLGYSYIFGG